MDQTRKEELERMMREMDFSLTPDLPTIDTLVEEVENDLKRRRKESQIKFCGNYARRTNVPDGASYKYEWLCGYWRECESCFGKRARSIGDRLLRIELMDVEVGVIEADEATIRRVIRHLRYLNNEYVRYPIYTDRDREEMSFILIYDTDGVEEGKVPESELTMNDIDEQVLAYTPKGKRWSGTLGREEVEKEEEEGETIVVSVKEVIVKDLDMNGQDEAWKRAVELTDHLDPSFDAEELSFACWARMQEYKRQVEKMGGVVAMERSVRVKVSDSVLIDWKGKRLNDKKMMGNREVNEVSEVGEGNFELSPEMKKYIVGMGVSEEQLHLL